MTGILIYLLFSHSPTSQANVKAFHSKPTLVASKLKHDITQLPGALPPDARRRLLTRVLIQKSLRILNPGNNYYYLAATCDCWIILQLLKVAQSSWGKWHQHQKTLDFGVLRWHIKSFRYTINSFRLDTLPVCAATTWSRIKIMSDVLSWHQVLITPSIFSTAESLLFFRQTIFTQQQQLVVQRLSSHAGRTGEQPVCYAWMLQKFCCGDSSQFRSVPLIHFSLSLPPPLPLPLGSPPPVLLPSHGQWSWDGLELETRLIRHQSRLLEA